MMSDVNDYCALCGTRTGLQTHHVLGRVGKFKDEPYNLLRLCFKCHDRWHRNRTKDMENEVYMIMKSKHGDKFPMKVNGRPYKTKWLVRVEDDFAIKKSDTFTQG